MKRSRSCSPTVLPLKQRKSVHLNTSLTFDALKEHDKNSPHLSPFARFDMAPDERSGTLSDIPTIPPPSTRSSHRSRSSSPSRPSAAQYRGGHLRRANIFVDDEIPTDIINYMDKKVFHCLMSDDALLHTTSEKLWSKSKELVRKSSGEAEWTEALHTAIDELRFKGLEIVRNRDWREDLKPPIYNPQPTIPRKRSQPHEALQNASTHPSQVFESGFLPPAIPVFKLKDPCPDICVGLSDESIIIALEPKKGRNVAKRFLLDLQDTFRLISDPHVTPLGLRFPFLIVEAKAGATGGNLYQAQNQAAVSGSTALQILKNMSDLQCVPDLDQGSQENIKDGNQPEQSSEFNLKLAFSVVTEGPIHELWLHFRRSNEDFCMACIGAWRTTLKDGSINLLRHLLAVLRWGNFEFRDTLIGALQYGHKQARTSLDR
ncbi:hypothetical protein BJX99DRAFT_269687 [Aspergillus californicus]